MKNVTKFLKTIGVKETHEEFMNDPKFCPEWRKGVEKQVARVENSKKQAIANMSDEEKEVLSTGAYYFNEDLGVAKSAQPGTSKKYNV